jgi:acyl dehydratase
MVAMTGTSHARRRSLDERLAGFALAPLEWRWEPRDVALYALAVGAGVECDLPLIYERHGPRVLPSFATVAVGMLVAPMVAAIDIDLRRLLHLEQSVTLAAPLPPRGRLLVERTVREVRFSERAAIVVVEDVGRDEDGAVRFSAASSWWVTGAGAGRTRTPHAAAVPTALPERPPDATSSWRTSPDQAALFRLAGDPNPIHVDPDFANEAGLTRPLLHGLCTLGAATLAVVRERCEGDPSPVRSLHARFARPVEPGDELATELWWSGPAEALLRTRVGDRVVLDAGRVTMFA